jgi:hypothetical protein
MFHVQILALRQTILPEMFVVFLNPPVVMKGYLKPDDYLLHVYTIIPSPLWYSGQSSWLQIWRPEFDSRHYQKKIVVGLERGPLSLVSTTEELLDRKVGAPV